ncbi:MAG: 4'-phosphopantetheinyl transferase superfamily protein [Desulfuromusa sp.]|nr:4'-phosphopantetheinyl transferase superfamily protein [Desulfuromusa sp.]
MAKNKLLLSKDELIRAERLLDSQKSSQFVISRAGSRTILGKYLDTDPKQISFQINPSGKPSLADSHCSSLTFNLSHSGQWAVLAIAKGIQVGVGIEFSDRTLNYQQLAEHYFNNRERVVLSRYSVARQHRGFYRLWTQKESVLKLVGSGFSQTDSFALADSRSALTFLKNFFLAPEYVAAVAVGKKGLSIVRLIFPSRDSVLSSEDELLK